MSVKQGRYDQKYLYGILKASNRSRHDQFVLRDKHTRDGIKTWLSVVETYSNAGCETLKVRELQKKLTHPYTDDFPGKLPKYLDIYGAALHELIVLHLTNIWSDQRKKEQLINNLSEEPTLHANILELTRHPEFTFNETVKHLQHDYAYQSIGTTKTPSLSYKTLVIDEDMDTDYAWLDMEQTVALVNKLSAETTHVQVYNTLSSTTVRDSLRIPPAVWERLEPTLRQKITHIKCDKI